MKENLSDSIPRMIDHTLLKPETTPAQIKKLCSEAKNYNFWSVCINPHYVPLAAAELAGSPTKVCTVIGFPLGANTASVKAFEAETAAVSGAAEVDMVINIGLLKAGKLIKVKEDIFQVVTAANNSLVKVILETAFLTEAEIITACSLAKEAGADFVKSSTGFAPAGANSRHIALMRRTVGKTMGVKASGGVRTLETLLEMVAAGANRIGTSSGVAIMKSLLNK